MIIYLVILFFLVNFSYGKIQIGELIFLETSSEYNAKYIQETITVISNFFESREVISVKDFGITPFVYRIDETFYIKFKIYTNQVFLTEDEVYIKSPLNENKWISALSNLVDRTVAILNGETLESYISLEDLELRKKINELSDNELTDIIEKNLGKIDSLQLISLMNLGYTYPLNFEISFLHFFRIWNIKDFFYIGIGTTLFKVYSHLPYETNTATTIFPLNIYFPVLVSKNFKYNDLIINFEWAWYRDFSTQTNTNNITPEGSSVSEATYIDLNIRYFLPYLIIKTGFHYNYVKQNFLFYAGLEIFVGRYSKE